MLLVQSGVVNKFLLLPQTLLRTAHACHRSVRVCPCVVHTSSLSQSLASPRGASADAAAAAAVVHHGIFPAAARLLIALPSSPPRQSGRAGAGSGVGERVRVWPSARARRRPARRYITVQSFSLGGPPSERVIAGRPHTSHTYTHVRQPNTRHTSQARHINSPQELDQHRTYLVNHTHQST